MGQSPLSAVVAVVVDGHPPVVDGLTEMAPGVLVSVASRLSLRWRQLCSWYQSFPTA